MTGKDIAAWESPWERDHGPAAGREERGVYSPGSGRPRRAAIGGVGRDQPCVLRGYINLIRGARSSGCCVVQAGPRGRVRVRGWGDLGPLALWSVGEFLAPQPSTAGLPRGLGEPEADSSHPLELPGQARGGRRQQEREPGDPGTETTRSQSSREEGELVVSGSPH